MESRQSQRIQAMVKLLLFKDGLPVATARTRNVSRGGLFVQTDYVDLDSSEMVEMELLSNQWTRIIGSGKHRGVVTHRAPDGFGVRFHDLSETERAALVMAVERSLHSASTS